MKHFANQYAHPLLNRYQAIDLLQGLRMPVTLEHTVSPRVSDGRVDIEIAAEAFRDSGAMALHLGEVGRVLGASPQRGS